MTAIIAFITANAGILVTLAIVLINLLTAIFNKNEKVTGVLAIVRSIFERISVLQPKNSKGTIKAPGLKAADPVFE